MVFTRLGTVFAWIALVVGVARLATGLIVAFNLQVPGFDASRYLGSDTSGRAIDQGIMVLLIAVALGTLTEIGRSLRNAA